jgi:hypothetical protein
MEEKRKDETLHAEPSEHEADLKTNPPETEAPLVDVPEQPNHTNSLAQKRGRMVAAGVLSAVILSAVAVAVAGVFGLTATWLKVCPTDLPINDPARYLSDELTKEKGEPRPLGVSGNIVEQTRLKGVDPTRTE